MPSLCSLLALSALLSLGTSNGSTQPDCHGRPAAVVLRINSVDRLIRNMFLGHGATSPKYVGKQNHSAHLQTPKLQQIDFEIDLMFNYMSRQWSSEVAKQSAILKETHRLPSGPTTHIDASSW
ncbi:hypothetical protein B0H15DRAFT_362283 [Mycena belliarum]|uniref:Uncharacterized protein n=1 Tax=Mycena belliarum TaxID=1033014 RepID=A0AAD6U455_9AGAR|nr:hypothetical protein B0H15DRAFT_362283 [Mycena belliae]